MSKSKKLMKRFIRKKRRNAREFRFLHFVPLTLVLRLDISHLCPSLPSKPQLFLSYQKALKAS